MTEDMMKWWEVKAHNEIIRDSASGIAASARLLMTDHGYTYEQVKEIAETAFRSAMTLWCPDPNEEPTPIKIRRFTEQK